MHCVAKRLRLNRMQQQVRRLTDLEEKGSHSIMKDLYEQAAKIGISCCSDAYRTNNPDGCGLVACCFRQNSKRISAALRTAILLEDADMGIGRLGFLLRAKKCIDELQEIEIKAQEAFEQIFKEFFASKSGMEPYKDYEDFQDVLGLIAHKTRCIRNEIDMIEESMPDNVRRKLAVIYDADKKLLETAAKVKKDQEEIQKLAQLCDEIALKNKEVESILKRKNKKKLTTGKDYQDVHPIWSTNKE